MPRHDHPEIAAGSDFAENEDEDEILSLRQCMNVRLSGWYAPVALWLTIHQGPLAGQTTRPPEPLSFQSRAVTVQEGQRVDDFSSKGEAKVCLEGPPKRQCHTAPGDYNRFAKVEIVRFNKAGAAMLFSASTGGVSGFMTHLALVRPIEDEDELDDLFSITVSLPSQSEHAFWRDLPQISTEPIFMTAEFVWGLDESHFSPHRYIISSYVMLQSRELERPKYSLFDRYMTIRRYDPQARKVLISERAEALLRLRRAASASR